MPDLFERFRRLDDVRVPDLRTHIEDREPREPLTLPATSVRRRVIAGVVAFAVFAGAGVLAWRALAPGGSRHRVSVASVRYRDPLGWSIRVPKGWYEVPFDVSDVSIRYQGVQLSNVVLPTPAAASGTPPQPIGTSLPGDGVAIIIARTSGAPGSDEVPLPLSMDDFVGGSSTGGGPVLETANFAAGGYTFVATAKFGAKAYRDATIRVVGRAVASFRFRLPSASSCAPSQLSGSIAGTEGAAGTQFVTIALRNTSSSPCSLEGSPSVELLDASGASLRVREQTGLPEGPSLEPSTLLLHPGQTATVTIATHDVNVGAQPCVEASSARISPTGGGGIDVALPSVTEVCDGNVWVAPFTVLG